MSFSIPYGRQSITDQDLEAVIETLKSPFLTQGPKIQEFELAFADYVGCKYAVAVSNGTGALHLAAMALNVKSGDKIITSPITFAASANCIRYCGGEVAFCDIDPETFLMDINQLRNLLGASPKGTYKGIIPVDFAGKPVNTEDFRELADEFGCWIIQDACHSPGAFFTDSKGSKRKSGDGQYADLTVFSFHPVKHIATGEGGMITTNNEALFRELLRLRTHGIVRENFEISTDEIEQGAWYYEMQTLGYNYRLTDFQAALGISQLKRADIGLVRRNQIANHYLIELADLPIGFQKHDDDTYNAYHLFVITTNERKALYDFLKANGIYCQVHYIPVHRMPYYQSLGWRRGDYPQAENYYSRCLSIPMYPTLTDEEQTYIIGKIKSFFEQHG